MNKFIMLIGLGALLGHSSCQTEKAEGKEMETAEAKFLVTSPLKKDTTITREYVCQIRSVNHIELIGSSHQK